MILHYDFGTPLYIQSLELRDLVLRKPLGLSIWNDPLDQEYDQVHIAYFTAQTMAAVCVLQVKDDNLKMRQVAVDPKYAKQGLGRKLVAYCEAFAVQQKADSLYCHARNVAQAFYEKCGWKPFDDPFTEVGIDHQKMYWPQLHRPKL